MLFAALLTVGGAMVAVLAGLPEAALLVAPWMVLLVVGLSNSQPANLRAAVEVGVGRVLVGDDIDVDITVTGAAGSALITCLPSDGFWDPQVNRQLRSATRVADVLTEQSPTVTCSLPALVWGAHDVGRVLIEVTEPYGLFRRSGVVSSPVGVRVHPTPTDLQNLLAPWLVRRITGAHRSTALGRGVEYADIREFGPGDSLRDINWRASARSQDLWVSQRHPDRTSDVILLLDSFVESGHDVRKVVGLAIEACVALAESHLSVTDRVGLVDLGGVVRWVAPGTGQMQLQRLTDTLLKTGLYANPTEKQLGVIPPRALPPRSFVIALSPLLDERFIDALSLLAARGHDVAVIECDAAWPDVEEPHPSSAFALRMWQAEREVVRDGLAESGISVAIWREGTHLDLVLGELSRRRHRAVRVSRR
jgi:uncharacterized protein (DUF58 family)